MVLEYSLECGKCQEKCLGIIIYRLVCHFGCDAAAKVAERIRITEQKYDKIYFFCLGLFCWRIMK